jgi:hypothetical protein
LGVKNADREPELLLNHPDRKYEIRVIRDDDSLLKEAVVGVNQQQCCDVHVGALLFRDQHPCVGLASHGKC